MSRALLSPSCILLSPVSHSFSRVDNHAYILSLSFSHSAKHTLGNLFSLEWVTTARHLVLSISASYFPQNLQSFVRIVRSVRSHLYVTRVNVFIFLSSLEFPGRSPGRTNVPRCWTATLQNDLRLTSPSGRHPSIHHRRRSSSNLTPNFALRLSVQSVQAQGVSLLNI